MDFEHLFTVMGLSSGRHNTKKKEVASKKYLGEGAKDCRTIIGETDAMPKTFPLTFIDDETRNYSFIPPFSRPILTV